METTELKGAIEPLLNEFKSGIETSVNNAKAEASQSATEIKEALTTQINEIKAEVKEMNLKAARTPLGGGATKSFHDELGDKLNERKADLTNTRLNKKGFVIDMQAKAVATMSSSGSLTGSYFVAPQVVPGVVAKPFNEVHMRDLMPVGTTNSNTIRYVVDNGGEGGPTMVAEGGTKPKIDRDLEIKDSAVRKIATYFRVPEEMIEDIPYLQSFLAQIGIEEVMAVEDTQIIYGDGTGQNLNGIHTTATAFAAGTSVIGASSNEFDVLRAAKKQLRVAKFTPNVALVSPTDWFNMTSRKDSNNNYLFLGGGNGINTGMSVDGLRIVEHNAVTTGDFLVGDFRNAAIFDRTGTQVRFYDQDQDNAILNLITIVIEKRLALVNYRPTAFVKGTFSAAITDLTS